MSRGNVLHAAPPRFLDESLASWIQRICGRHACSLTWFRRYFSLPPECDFDLDLSEEQWSRILEVIGFTAEWLYDLEYIRALQAAEHWENYQYWMSGKRYGWCTACFHADKEPYFRRSWRFGPRICAVHGVPLLAACPFCNRAQDLRRPRRMRLPNMAFCQHCGQWLAAAATKTWPTFPGSPLDSVRKRFVAGVASIREAQPPTSKPLDWRLYETRRQTESLVIDAIQFTRPDKLRWWPRFGKGGQSRTLLAAALVLFRHEVRAIRNATKDNLAVPASRGPRREEEA